MTMNKVARARSPSARRQTSLQARKDPIHLPLSRTTPSPSPSLLPWIDESNDTAIFLFGLPEGERDVRDVSVPEKEDDGGYDAETDPGGVIVEGVEQDGGDGVEGDVPDGSEADSHFSGYWRR
ncbi:MAG: hypothetical protein Q9160_002089 [Pyrenula sp. 1 TL-2023]